MLGCDILLMGFFLTCYLQCWAFTDKVTECWIIQKPDWENSIKKHINTIVTVSALLYHENIYKN